jgi:hypothetical protein
MAPTSTCLTQLTLKPLNPRQEGAPKRYRYRRLKQRENCRKRIKITADAPYFVLILRPAKMARVLIVSAIRLKASALSGKT